jgi:sugar phosphate isomerase/epimerase
MKLAFSTLACPTWGTRRAAEAAREYGYDGIELRLIKGRPIDSAFLREQRGAVSAELDGLPIASLNSSIRLAVDGDEWQDEFAALTELALELNVPSVRVWGGDYGPELSEQAAIAQVAARLNTAEQIATHAGVFVALETHDAWRNLRTVTQVFSQVESDQVKVLWDVQNTHAQGGSTPEEVWAALGDRIAQIHVKDARPGEGEYGELVELGTGTVPVRESIDVLVANGFDGWITVNWLKFQHPEILDPKIALPQYATVLRQWIAAARDEMRQPPSR